MKEIITNQMELKQQFELMKTISGVGEKTGFILRATQQYDPLRKYRCRKN